MTDVPEIRLCDIRYRLPFARLFPTPSASQHADLSLSIQRYKVLDDVQTYDSPTWGIRCVIDGARRLRIASDLGLSTVPVLHRGEMTDDTARAWCLTLNKDRRPLTPEEIAVLRETRNEAIIEDRGLGESLRSIAARHHLSPRMVRKILKAAGVYQSPPIKGRDGKTYPAPVALPPYDTTLATAQRTIVRLRAVLDQLSAGEAAPRFQAACLHHGVSGGLDGLLATFEAVLADLANQSMQVGGV